MAPAARYDSENVSAAPLGKPLEFAFSGKTAPNRLYVSSKSNRHKVYELGVQAND